MEDDLKNIFDSDTIFLNNDNFDKIYDDNIIDEFFLEKKLSFGFFPEEIILNNNNYYNSNYEEKNPYKYQDNSEKQTNSYQNNEDFSDKKNDHIETKSNSLSQNFSSKKSIIINTDKKDNSENLNSNTDSYESKDCQNKIICNNFFYNLQNINEPNKINQENLNNNEFEKIQYENLYNKSTEFLTYKKNTKYKIFDISKDNINYQKNFFKELPLSVRMKIKKEKTKVLLGEKTKRINFSESNLENDKINSSIEDYIPNYKKENNISDNEKKANKINNTNNSNILINTSTNSNFDLNISNSDKEPKDYIIEDDKLIIINDKLDEKTKKEIRILRNRISAQKSRDRKKIELKEFKHFSNNLYDENQSLKNEINKKEQEFLLLKKKIKNYENNLCEKCKYLKNYEPIHPNFIQNKIIKSQNNFPSTIVDISNATRRNISNNLRLGVFSGVLLLVFIIGCLVWGQLDEINTTITRKLFYLYDRNINNLNFTKSPNKPLNIISQDGNNIEGIRKDKIFNITKKYPIVKYNKSNLNNLTDKGNKSKENLGNVKILDKFSNKLADYNINKYTIDVIKSFLNRKKNEFLLKITKKLYQINSNIDDFFGQDYKNIEKIKNLKVESNEFLKSEIIEKEKKLNILNYNNLPLCYNTENIQVSVKYENLDNIKNLTNKEIVHESYFLSNKIFFIFR